MRLNTKYYQNDKGNIALFVLAALSMMMILFVFIFNMGSALATKEKSFTVTKQASLAATSSFYEQIREALVGYSVTYGNDDNQQVWDFDTEWSRKISRCAEGSDSFNECRVKVLEEIVDAALGVPLLGQIIKAYLSSQVNKDQILTAARNTIISNKGTTVGALLKIEGNRFKIKAAAEFSSISYGGSDQGENGGYLDGINKNIYRYSQGPEISFLEEILLQSTYSLE